MALAWDREEAPRWDPDKQGIIGGAPPGVFDIDHADGSPLPGDWWSTRDEHTVVGYGWLDVAWGDAEILLAVDPQAQATGVGSFVLDNIEHEAAARGVNYVYNTVRATHPRRAEVQEWLQRRGFRGDDRDDTLRKRVRVRANFSSVASTVPEFDEGVDMPPGHEESGGYVDAADHRY